MNKFVLLLIAFIGCTAVASQEAHFVYAALNVSEVALPDSPTLLKYQKSVGGLVCQKISSIREDEAERGGYEYSCSLDFSQVDSVRIYHALDLEEQALPGSRTLLKYQKSVGGLVCIKEENIRIGDSFVCSYEF